MRLLRRNALVAAVAVVAVLGAAFAATAASARTQAAWTDRVYASAAVTSGSWATVANTCTALDQNGKSVACTVTGIHYDGWGTAGNQTRNYYIDFNASSAKTITFSVDLSTATGAAGSWSWSNAGVGAAAQFAPTGGWTCSSLPRVTGKANDWYTTVYFPVYENRTGQSVMCG